MFTDYSVNRQHKLHDNVVPLLMTQEVVTSHVDYTFVSSI